MSLLEEKRAILEELELIEDAISDRIARNPEVFYSYIHELSIVNSDEKVLSNIPNVDITANRVYMIKKSKRSRKQILLQQHEISKFLSYYLKNVKKLNGYKNDNVDEFKDHNQNFELFRDQIQRIKEKYAEESNSEAFDASLEARKYQYTMFSNSNHQKKDILSLEGQSIDINKKFSWEEHYGEYLHLDQYHQEYLNIVKNANVSLLQFIGFLQTFCDHGHLKNPPVDRNSKIYHGFLERLLKYVNSFFESAFPLINHVQFQKRIKNSFVEYTSTPIEDSSRGCLCVACGKWFKAITVYTSHLQGRKHLNNLKCRRRSLMVEYTLQNLFTCLNKELVSTKSFVERKYAFTVEERIQELAKLRDAYNANAYGDHEREDSQEDLSVSSSKETPPDDNNPLNLPLGPDGYPIPYWLYKLQGLDIEYTCEICGNHLYKGRRVFERHFHEQRHTYGLRCLGIEPTSTFKGISKISDAQILWSRLKNNSHLNSASATYPDATSSRAVVTNNKLEIEMEDEDGNVMSHRVYEDLKKQGLL
ncbi:SF3a splicing factor complex subunit PRP9 Ecym_3549 [Eremothecium cymbalariae DBVPG|uniref:Matrin-type domain-containing protein n=1 Tax=Eremothecium cymbalariae (strain CBS 270.75 / DBVPG 7215 / KCTC 17166 / NRRL Y-17582) TaxID=931890 RepID=G8JQN9_ERECY|nr:Hypothetical protein Ecym_3549 [Eremothecium cymbalariae DBVPG\